jgi:hypothetical protein
VDFAAVQEYYRHEKQEDSQQDLPPRYRIFVDEYFASWVFRNKMENHVPKTSPEHR